MSLRKEAAAGSLKATAILLWDAFKKTLFFKIVLLMRNYFIVILFGKGSLHCHSLLQCETPPALANA